MKKILAIVMVVSVLGAVLVGCKGGDAAASDSAAPSAPAK
jgi:hypothetical protein